MAAMNYSSSIHIHRPVIPVTIAMMAGIAAGVRLPGHWQWAALGLLLPAALMIRYTTISRQCLGAPVLICLLAGYLSIQPWLAGATPEQYVDRYVGRKIWRIHGVIARQPRVDEFRWRFVLAADVLEAPDRRIGVSGLVTVSGGGVWPGLNRGDRVSFSGRLRAVRSFANPGGFDYERFMAMQAVRVRVYARDGTLRAVPGEKPGVWRNALDRLRERLSGRMTLALKDFPQATVDFLKAVLLGDRNGLSASVREDFNRAGVGHVLAISGIHIGMVAAAAFAVARWLLGWIPFMLRHAWTRKGAALAALVSVLGYGMLAGLTPSTQRAMLTAGVLMLGYWAGRRHDWLNTVALAALVILLIHPPALLSISFQLSFMAVLSILSGLNICSAGVLKPTSTIWQRLARRTIGFLTVSIMAILGTLPLVLHYFNQASLAGVVVNLVVVPVVGLLVVPCGLAGILVAGWNAGAAGVLWYLSALGGELVRLTVAWAAQWPWAVVRCFTPNGIEIGLYYLLAAVLLFRKKMPKPKAAVALVLVFISLDAVYWLHQRFGGRSLRVTVLDVGQGTANLIQFPGGFTMLVDGGGFSTNSGFDVGRNIVAPLLRREKIGSLDLVVLSHANSDHLNGLLFILENFKVKTVWSNGQGCPGAGYRQWQRRVANEKIEYLTMGQVPDRVALRGVRLEVLAPPPDFKHRSAFEPWRDLNNNSMVLRVSYGDVSFLFPGDIMAPAERDLIARSGAIRMRGTILVVPHHGSRSSSTAAFLEAVRPKEALISAGWDNRFGFPHVQVLRRFHEHGIRTWCTAQDGAIRIVTDGKTYRIQTFRNKSCQN